MIRFWTSLDQFESSQKIVEYEMEQWDSDRGGFRRSAAARGFFNHLAATERPLFLGIFVVTRLKT
ncbi:hypothetical protein JQ611_27250 [Bradyrhizobium sp. AUGA SZCCT0182]|nr:hypothetical protein [Bradyrhizobium sp. AUGA SZCCT0182]